MKEKPKNMLDKLANFIMKHSWAVLCVWVIALLCAVPFAMNYENVMSYDITEMSGSNSEATDGLQIINDNFYTGTSTDAEIVFTYNSAEELNAILSGFSLENNVFQEKLNEKYGVGKVIDSFLGKYSKDPATINSSGIYIVGVSYGEGLDSMDETGNMRSIVSDTKDAVGITATSYVTGTGPMAYDTMNGATEDVSKIDPFSILLVLLLLGLFFATIVTAAVPPVTVGIAYGIVLSLLYAIGCVMDIYYITGVIVLVSMLGAGCDYSIFIIARYREERKAGKAKEDAIREAVKWAGESVATSGCAVIIGFGVMSFCSYSLISTMGMILAIGIVVAMIAALTLIPAVISILGDKIFWPRTIESYQKGSKLRDGVYGKFVNFGKRYFHNAGKKSIKYAVPIVVAAIVVSVPLVYVAVTATSSYDMVSIMSDCESKEGIDAVVDNADGGLIMPTYAVYELESPIATVDTNTHTLVWTSSGMTYMTNLTAISTEIGALDNVDYALGPTPWQYVYLQVYQELINKGVTPTPLMVNTIAVQQLPEMLQPNVKSVLDKEVPGMTGVTLWDLDYKYSSSYIDFVVNYGGGTVSTDGTYAKIMIVMIDQPLSQTSMDTVKEVRNIVNNSASAYPDMVVDNWTTGYVASIYDISGIVNSEFTWIEAGVILLILLLLFFVLGSYFTPMRSLLTILMSIGWTIGMTHILFTNVLGYPVIWVVPIVLLVICLGLGMDYDILITTRIREGKKKGMTNDEAIINAMEKSGSIITLCGLIMGGTFLTLLVSSSPMLQEFGFALGFAILVDSLIVVTYVVPALMHLMGDWSWKGPKFLNRS